MPGHADACRSNAGAFTTIGGGNPGNRSATSNMRQATSNKQQATIDVNYESQNKKNGQPLPGAKQFQRNQFLTSADFLFLLLFSKQLRRNQFST
jgi:hypothetical protein